LDLLTRLDPSAATLKSAQSRTAQFDQVAGAFRAATQRRAVVALIEDVHWTDPATLDLLTELARDAAGRRILFVVTYRPEALGEEDPRAASVARLKRLSGATTIVLRPLARPEIRRLIGARLERGALAPETVARIEEISEGNPLFAEELVENAIESVRVHDGRPVLPISIRAAVLARAHPLDESDRTVLAQAAVVGRRFSIDLLAAMLDVPRDRVLISLQRARSARLIVEEDEGDFSFRHALTREAIYDTFLVAQRRVLHRRIAGFLEALPATRRCVQDLAHHWWAARDPAKAIEYGEAAGDAAFAVFSNEEAARYFGYCREFLEANSAQAGRIYLKLGYAQVRCDSWALGARSHSEAVDAFRSAGDLEGECDATEELVSARFALGDSQCCDPLLDLLGRIPDDKETHALRARVEIYLAHVYSTMGRFAEASAVLAAADLGAVRLRPRSLTQYQATRASLAAARADVEEYRAAMAEALALSPAHSEANRRAIILSNLAQALTDLGRVDDAARVLDDAEALARADDFRQTLLYCTMTRAAAAFLTGRLHEARERVEAALGAESDYERVRPRISALGVAVALLLRDDALLARCYDESLVRSHPLEVAAPYAELMASRGRLPDALALLRAALQRPVSARNPFPTYVAVARLGESGDLAAARGAVAEIASCPQDVVFKAVLPLFDAIVAQRFGFPGRVAEAAATAFHDLRFPVWEAEALELSQRHAEAAQIYRQIGAVRRVKRDDRPAPQDLPADDIRLSPREQEVATHAARGLSNSEIASELCVSTKAVEKHLSSIYQKLGVSSRSKLVLHMAAKQASSAP